MSEILSERSLNDVGVRSGKFYLAARGEAMDIDKFAATGELDGIKGISSSREIWGDFSPNVGRDMLIIMPAEDTLKINKLKRVQYDDAEVLVRNNSQMLGRILSINNVARNTGDNIIVGVFDKIPGIRKLGYDPASVSNRAISLAHHLRSNKAIDGDSYFQNVDTSKFGNWMENGLKLSSIDDYANLYYQAAKAAGYYGEAWVKFFAPQNRSKWYPAISQGVIRQANVYSNESEWVNLGGQFHAPKNSTILLAVPAYYYRGRPVDDSGLFAKFADGTTARWSPSDTEKMNYLEHAIDVLSKSSFDLRLVDYAKTANTLVKKQGQRWDKHAAKKNG